MTASFIQTSDGSMLSAAGGFEKLHIGYARMSANEKPGVFADHHLVGYPDASGDVQLMLENLATRAASSDGVFGIENGSIYRRFITERNGLQIIHYGSGENQNWSRMNTGSGVTP